MKKSKLLLASAILGSLYLIYLISHFAGSMATSDETEAVGGAIAIAIVAPHMICVGLSTLFNWTGWALNARWAALVSGILYAVSIVLMVFYAPFVILQMIFSFVAFSKMKRTE